jgi:hypothetical protein
MHHVTRFAIVTATEYRPLLMNSAGELAWLMVVSA